MRTGDFLQTRRVFSLDEAERALAPRGGRKATFERLRYHMTQGRVRGVARGVYASVAPGTKHFMPDPFLVAAVVRPDAVFCYHSALELLGAGHSVWNVCTVFTTRRRVPVRLEGGHVEFLGHPVPLRRHDLAVRRVDRAGEMLKVTSPERTLVEGFRDPRRVGGLEELVESAAGFATLDLDLLRRVLVAYDEKLLWAAVGWFLERFQQKFYVPEKWLRSIEARRPKSPLYLLRADRGGRLQARWNLILPEVATQAGSVR